MTAPSNARRLKILLVDHAPVFGGVEAMLTDLASEVNREAFELVIATEPDSPALDRFRQTGARVRPVRLASLRGGPVAGLRLLNSATQLAQLARLEHANVIHTFTARTHVIGAQAARLARLPLLWRLNDETLPLWLARRLSLIPRQVITVSSFLAGRYHRLRSPMTVIPDGIPIRPLRPPPSPAQPPTVTLAARLVRWKGQTVFIEALARAIRQLPDLRAEIVGRASPTDNVPGPLGGGEPYRQKLLKLAQARGLEEMLTFHDFREPDLLFAESALAVHASTLPEPFGRTIVEAMAAGLPVIGTRGGGVTEIILNGITGRLVPAGDAPALADAMMELAADPARRAVLGQAGRERAAECFNVEQMARRFEAAWLEARG